MKCAAGRRSAALPRAGAAALPVPRRRRAMGCCASASDEQPSAELTPGTEHYFTCGRGDDVTWRLDTSKATCDLVVTCAEQDGTLKLKADNTGSMKVTVRLSQESTTTDDILADLQSKMSNPNFRSWTRTFAVRQTHGRKEVLSM
jgi:hypothetical protein